MFFGRRYPYSNLHDLNLDWIISEISSLKEADAEALAAILEQGITGDSFKWQAHDNTLIVTDNYGVELYRVVWDENGFTMSRGGGTPVTYRVANGTLTAPTINSTALRAGSANVTGTVVAGEIHTTAPVAVQYGGTGADNAADARTNLGAMADGTVPISKGGTGATTAAAACTNLGAVPATRTVNGHALTGNIQITAGDVNAVPSSGGTFTGDVTRKGNGWPAIHFEDGSGNRLMSIICAVGSHRVYFRMYDSQGGTHDFRLPDVWSGAVSGGIYDLSYTP